MCYLNFQMLLLSNYLINLFDQSNDDLYKMHQAISHLTESEEEVLDMHKNISEVGLLIDWID